MQGLSWNCASSKGACRIAGTIELLGASRGLNVSRAVAAAVIAIATAAVVPAHAAPAVREAARSIASGGSDTVQGVANRAENAAREAAAKALLRDAEIYLDLNQWHAAHRILEHLIGQFGDTVAATVANRHRLALEARFSGGFAVRPEDIIESDDGGGKVPDVRRFEARPPVADGAPRRHRETAGAALQQALRDVVGDRVYFAPHSAALGASSAALIRRQLAWLSSAQVTKIVIEAHADEPGADSRLNARIAEARALVVRNALIAGGVEPARLGIAVVGDRQPEAACRSLDCRARNRRVVTLVEGSWN